MQKAEARRKKEAEAHAAKQHNEAESTQKADVRRKKEGCYRERGYQYSWEFDCL